MENMNKGLLKLIHKLDKKKLNSFERWRLNSILSNYLNKVIPETNYITSVISEGLNISQIKERLNQNYYEAKQIPDEIIKETLRNMKKVDNIYGRYAKVNNLSTYCKESLSFI